MSDELELLVLGGGAAGFAAAGAFRAAGGGGAVGIVTDELRMPYRRPPLTKELLRGEATEEQLPLAQESWLVQQGVRLISGRAVGLDSEARTVDLSGGRRLRYADCVLATGAEPIRLPVRGADDPAVRVLRTVADVRELLRRLGGGDQVIVIGSGFIGCEIASSLRTRGHPVTLVSDEQAPNIARLGGGPAAQLLGWLEQDGIRLCLGAGVDAIERDGETLEVLAGGSGHRARHVIMAVGVAPRGELATALGIELEGGAVPVNPAMRTVCPGLLAAGDVCLAENAAAGRKLRVEHWGDALGQGEVAGASAAGAEVAWADVPGFWSTIGRRTLKYAAWGDGFQEMRLELHGAGGFTAWYGSGGSIVGVLAHLADEDYERGRELIAAGAPWDR